MITERILLTGILAVLGVVVVTVMRQAHMRRLNRTAMPMKAAGAIVPETAVSAYPTLLYFRSDGCAACPTQARHLDQLMDRWNGRVSIRKIDADAEPEAAAQFGIFTLPTTIVMDGAGIVRQINYGLTNTHKLIQQLETLSK